MCKNHRERIPEGARRADSSLLRAEPTDPSEATQQRTKTSQKARVHVSQVSTALRKQRSQMERGRRKCNAKRVHGLKNEPAPSAPEKIIHGRMGGVGFGGGVEWRRAVGGDKNKSHRQRRADYSGAAV